MREMTKQEAVELIINYYMEHLSKDWVLSEIREIIQYGCTGWENSSVQELTETVENITKRTCKIIG